MTETALGAFGKPITTGETGTNRGGSMTETALFVGGPQDGNRAKVNQWPVEVVRYSDPNYSAVSESSIYEVDASVSYERGEYERLVVAGADKVMHVLAVFKGWPSDQPKSELAKAQLWKRRAINAESALRQVQEYPNVVKAALDVAQSLADEQFRE